MADPGEGPGVNLPQKSSTVLCEPEFGPPPPSKSKSVGCQKAILHFQNVSVSVVLIGSLSNDDGDGSENVPEKVNSRCFKLHRSYFNSFNLSNVGDFFRS